MFVCEALSCSAERGANGLAEESFTCTSCTDEAVATGLCTDCSEWLCDQCIQVSRDNLSSPSVAHLMPFYLSDPLGDFFLFFFPLSCLFCILNKCFCSPLHCVLYCCSQNYIYNHLIHQCSPFQAHKRVKVTKDHIIKGKGEVDSDSPSKTQVKKSLFCNVHPKVKESSD